MSQAPMKPHRPPWAGPVEKILVQRPVSRALSKFMHKIDTPLLRLTRGRLSIGYGYPVMLLTTVGAKSNRTRTVPLLYVDLGDDRVGIIGTSFGSTRHPSWYHNLRAHPACTVQIKGREWNAVARLAEGEEREAIWRRANENYSGYDVYTNWTEGRTPPVFVLDPEA